MINMISVRELRPKLSTAMDRVNRRFDRYVVTRRGRPQAVLMSFDDYESLLETVEVRSDAALMARLRKADAEVAARKGTRVEVIEKRLGLV
ncbi:MAG: type II toxin-antitoxin system Phd/YefM family antitoxin [Candidatus Omnitrophica bacterium]|nr:type II toxin-antitoxin system Phd/YefM family antitoxin [Candidatus Omnitrophota bacterium]